MPKVILQSQESNFDLLARKKLYLFDGRWKCRVCSSWKQVCIWSYLFVWILGISKKFMVPQGSLVQTIQPRWRTWKALVRKSIKSQVSVLPWYISVRSFLSLTERWSVSQVARHHCGSFTILGACSGTIRYSSKCLRDGIMPVYCSNQNKYYLFYGTKIMVLSCQFHISVSFTWSAFKWHLGVINAGLFLFVCHQIPKKRYFCLANNVWVVFRCFAICAKYTCITFESSRYWHF